MELYLFELVACTVALLLILLLVSVSYFVQDINYLQQQRVNQEAIPMDVYIQKGVHRRGLSDAQLCQVMGVLLDNAREAAKESAAPYISLEMRNIDHSLEVIIRNTFGADTPTFQQSSKAHHEGLGLQSVRDILRTNPRANLNLRAEGQYVVAQMVVDG